MSSGNNWSALQDILLIKGREQHSDKWVAVSNSVPGKSPVECAERYKELVRLGVISVEDVTSAHKSVSGGKRVRNPAGPRLAPLEEQTRVENQGRTSRSGKSTATGTSGATSLTSSSRSRTNSRKREPLKALQIQSSPLRSSISSFSKDFPVDPILLDTAESQLRTAKKARIANRSRRALATSPVRNNITRPSIPKALFSDIPTDPISCTMSFLESSLGIDCNASVQVPKTQTSQNDKLLEEFFMLDDLISVNDPNSGEMEAGTQKDENRNIIAGFTPVEDGGAPLFPEIPTINGTSIPSQVAPLTPVTDLATDPVLPTFPHSSDLGDIFFSDMDIFRPQTNLALNTLLSTSNTEKDAILEDLFGASSLNNDASTQNSMSMGAASHMRSHAANPTATENLMRAHSDSLGSTSNTLSIFDSCATDDFSSIACQVGSVTDSDIEKLFQDSLDPRDQMSFSEQIPKVVFEPDWVSGPSHVFSLDQISQLRNQLALSLQISVQAFTHHAIVDGVEDDNTRFWGKQLMNQVQFCQDKHLSPTSDTTSNPHMTVQGLEHVESLVNDINGSKENGSAVPGKIAIKYSKLFDPYFDASWKVPLLSHSTHQRSRADFTAEEDELLFWGIFHFGMEEIASVRTHYLPARTYSEIQSRLNKVIHISPDTSKLKDLHSMPFKPLTVVQKHVLKNGIEKFGYPFKNMLATLFPNTPSLLVEIAWDELFSTKVVNIPWSADRLVLPKSAASAAILSSALNSSASLGLTSPTNPTNPTHNGLININNAATKSGSVKSTSSKSSTKKNRKKTSYKSYTSEDDSRTTRLYDRQVVSSPLSMHPHQTAKHADVKRANELLFESRANLRQQKHFASTSKTTTHGFVNTQSVSNLSSSLRRRLGKSNGYVEVLSDHHIVTKPVLKNRRDNKSSNVLAAPDQRVASKKSSRRVPGGNKQPAAVPSLFNTVSDASNSFLAGKIQPLFPGSNSLSHPPRINGPNSCLVLPSDDGYLASCQSSEPDLFLNTNMNGLVAAEDGLEPGTYRTRNELAEALLCRWNSDFETDLEGTAPVKTTSTSKSRAHQHNNSMNQEPLRIAAPSEGLKMSRISEEDTEDGQFPKVDFTGMYNFDDESGDEAVDSIHLDSDQARLLLDSVSRSNSPVDQQLMSMEVQSEGQSNHGNPRGVGRAGQRKSKQASDIFGQSIDDDSLSIPIVKRSRRCFKKRSHSSHSSSAKSKHKARKKQTPHSLSLTGSFTAADLTRIRRRDTRSPIQSEPVYISPDHMHDFFK